MKKVILGATGSIGSTLAKSLVKSGDEVHLVGRDEANLSSLANVDPIDPVAPKITFFI